MVIDGWHTGLTESRRPTPGSKHKPPSLYHWIRWCVYFWMATFSNEDENEDEDWYDRLGPGTRTSSTAVFRRETKTFSKPVTVRGRVSSYSESHQGKCLSKNLVTSLYFSTAMKLFPMKSFCYFTIVSSQRTKIFPMKTINGFWTSWWVCNKTLVF